MSYSDYGSFVYLNGERQTQKEDVGIYDTDEGELPSGFRLWFNMAKRQNEGTRNVLWKHSQHGVMGNQHVRVACYKQGLPSIWDVNLETGEPFEVILPELNTDGENPAVDYFCYNVVECEYKGHKFKFIDNDTSESGHYEAIMITPSGNVWKCEYDYLFGAGHSDVD